MDRPKDFGNDRIVPKGEQILVYTGIEMPDWRVSRYRRAAIVIGDRTYFVAQKETFNRGTIRYTLEPWPESLVDLPGKTIHYDAEYVRARDHAVRNVRQREILSDLLRLVKPLIGLLPSEAKIRIEAQYGISARSATFFSLWLELIAFLAAGTVILIATFGGLRSAAIFSDPLFGSIPILIPVALFLLLETAVRYGSYLGDTHSPYGFCEWIFRRRH